LTHLLFSAVAVRVVDWTFTLLALAGIAICTYTAIDAQLDLRAVARAGVNGSLRAAGRIARRGAIASGALHAGFFAVGLTASLGRVPPASQWSRAVLVGGVFIVVQGGIVFAQVRNQLERDALRRRR
jgi:hypothetical protein